MTRARSLAALLVAAILLLSACRVDVEVGIEVDVDGSGEVTVEVLLDGEAAARIPDLDAQLRVEDLEEAGWTVTGPEPEAEGGTSVTATKPFADPDDAVRVLAEVAGEDGPLHATSLARSRSFGETTWRFTATVDLGEGLEVVSDEALVEALGDPFGGNLELVEQEVGTAVEEQVGVALRVDLPGGDPQVIPLELGASQEIEVAATDVRWDTRAWAALAIVLLVALVVVVVWRLRRDRRDRRAADSEPAGDEAEDGEPDDREVGESAAADQPADEVDAPGADEEPTREADASRSAPAATGPPAEPGQRRLRLVILNAMGVVFSTGRDIDDLFVTFARDEGSTMTREQLTGRLHEATLGGLAPHELWPAAGVDGDPDELTDRFLALHRPSTGVRAFLERMAERDLPVVVVSNDVAAWSHKLRDAHRLEGLVAAWLVSSELGHRLPDRSVYEAISEAGGVPSANGLFIDTELRFLAAARSYGFATAWFNAEPEPGDEDAGYPLLRSFRDLGLG